MQKLFAKRGHWEGYIKPTSFWQSKDVRKIDDFNNLEATYIEIAKSIVQAFDSDAMTQAIAVTFKYRFDGGVDTYIWAKNSFFQK